jgi:hypothetical protein
VKSCTQSGRGGGSGKSGFILIFESSTNSEAVRSALLQESVGREKERRPYGLGPPRLSNQLSIIQRTNSGQNISWGYSGPAFYADRNPLKLFIPNPKDSPSQRRNTDLPLHLRIQLVKQIEFESKA